jgi:hypothetical protein
MPYRADTVLAKTGTPDGVAMYAILLARSIAWRSRVESHFGESWSQPMTMGSNQNHNDPTPPLVKSTGELDSWLPVKASISVKT